MNEENVLKESDFNKLQAGNGVLQMTIQITRKETGKVEEYFLTSIPQPEETKE